MLDIVGHHIRAVSIGGLDTCIELPGFKLCFDIGHCPQTAVRLPRVLFTHAHTDHMGGVAHHCAGRDMMGMKKPEYVMPISNVAAFTQLMEAWRALNKTEMPHTVVGVRPGDRVHVGKDRWATVFQVLHRVPSVGYALCSTKHKLLPEFEGRPGRELGELRAAGTTITHPVETVEVAFCGDTLIETVEREEIVRNARLLVLECTFLDDRVSVADARKMGHVHLDELIDRVELFDDNEAILLTHFSSRYRASDITTILAERLPDGLRDRVTPLLTGHAG